MDSSFSFDDIKISVQLPPSVSGRIARLSANIAALRAEQAAAHNTEKISRLGHQIAVIERQQRALLVQYGGGRRGKPRQA